MKREKGQAVVELAIVLPVVLLVFVGGIVDFGFTFFNLISLQQLGNDVAMYAAEGNGTVGITDTSTLQSYVNSKRPAYWSTNPTVTLLPDTTITSGNDSATVRRIQLTYASPLYTPFWQSINQTVRSSNTINLAVMSAYQVPNVVAAR